MTNKSMSGSKLSLEPRQLNEYYLNLFRDIRHPDQDVGRKQFLAWSQYKSTLTKFFEVIDKPLYLIEQKDVQDFVNSFDNESTRKNKTNHIKALLVFLIQEDHEFFEQLTKEQVLWMLLL